MWFSLIALFAVLAQQSPQPYYDFSKAGAGFYGAGRETPDPVDLKSVKIGVLGPEKDPAGVQLRLAVDLALEDSNLKGGYRGRIPYQLVFRADDGPWGVVAGRIVDLAYEDQVWTIIGGLDGQRTHVAELIVAKAWVPVVTPSASDTSVDYANVPWVFRCAPADSAQADALIAYAKQRGCTQILALTEAEREAYTGYRRLQERLRKAHLDLTGHLQYPTLGPEQVVARLGTLKFDAILLWGSAGTAVRLIEAIRSAGINAPVLAPSQLALPEVAARSRGLGEVIVTAPFDISRLTPDRAGFARRFKARSGMDVWPLAFYAYDSARLIITAIEKTGLNRARIRDELANTSFEGLTGRIVFDSLRGNAAPSTLMTLKDYGWVTVMADDHP